MGGGHSLQETEINNGEILILTESKAVDGLAVCAPDTLDILQGNTAYIYGIGYILFAPFVYNEGE